MERHVGHKRTRSAVDGQAQGRKRKVVGGKTGSGVGDWSGGWRGGGSDPGQGLDGEVAGGWAAWWRWWRGSGSRAVAGGREVLIGLFGKAFGWETGGEWLAWCLHIGQRTCWILGDVVSRSTEEQMSARVVTRLTDVPC